MASIWKIWLIPIIGGILIGILSIMLVPIRDAVHYCYNYYISYVMPHDEKYDWLFTDIKYFDSLDLYWMTAYVLIACLYSLFGIIAALVIQTILVPKHTVENITCQECSAILHDILGPICPECGNQTVIHAEVSFVDHKQKYSKRDILHESKYNRMRYCFLKKWLLPILTGMFIASVYELFHETNIYVYIYDAIIDKYKFIEWLLFSLMLDDVIFFTLSIIVAIYVREKLICRKLSHEFQCKVCGYLLKGLQSPKCPECGHVGTIP